MPKMKSNFRGLVTLLAKNLYPEPDVFVRELIQNAHDSIQLRRVQNPDHAGQIHVSLEAGNRTITFSDDGTGMNQFVIEEFLSTIGASGTGTMTADLKREAQLDVATIGQFGIGLLSAFVVAERVDVYTRHFQTDEAWHWVNLGDDEYSLNPTTEMPQTGSQVIVTVKPEYVEFLREEAVEAVIRKYADLLPVPIFLNGRGPVNAVRPPWEVAASLPPVEREKHLTAFLNRRYPDFPLLIIPVNLPQLQTQGVLYITDQPIPGLNTSGLVDLYQNRMCLRPRDTELLPDWARFVRGIIDTRCLQPTAARDNVHRNADYYALRRALGELILQAILDCSNNSPDYFAKLCNWHHFHFKSIALTDDRFFDRLILHLPFETSQGDLTLEQYRAKQAGHPNQVTPIYYFPSNADSTRFYELCRVRQIIALNAGFFFEESLLKKLVDRQPGRWVLRRLDQIDSEDFYQRISDEESEAFAPLLTAIADALRDAGKPDVKVTVRRFEPQHISSMLLEAPQTAMSDSLKGLLNHPLLFRSPPSIQAEMSEALDRRSKELLLNASNPLVQRLSRLGNWNDEPARLALRGLYFSAILQSRGRLSSDNTMEISKLLECSLNELVSAHGALAGCQREAAALRKLVEERNDSLSGEEWKAASRALYGGSPSEFRERISRSTDEEVARTLAEMLTMNTSANKQQTQPATT